MSALTNPHPSPNTQRRAVGMSVTRLNANEVKRVEVGLSQTQYDMSSPARIVKLPLNAPPAPAEFTKRKDSLLPPPARVDSPGQDSTSEAGTARSIHSTRVSSGASTVIQTKASSQTSLDEDGDMSRKSGSNFKEEFETEKGRTPPRILLKAIHLAQEPHILCDKGSSVRGLSQDELRNPSLVSTFLREGSKNLTDPNRYTRISHPPTGWAATSLCQTDSAQQRYLLPSHDLYLQWTASSSVPNHRPNMTHRL